MGTNKYLEKAAGWLDKTIRFTDEVLGHSAGKLKHEAEILSNAHIKGRTAKGVAEEASHAHNTMIRSRTKAGLGAAAVGTAGFLGVHKYHQHKDNAILAKIDRMYSDPYQ
jgi:hypothetical protein